MNNPLIFLAFKSELLLIGIKQKLLNYPQLKMITISNTDSLVRKLEKHSPTHLFFDDAFLEPLIDLKMKTSLKSKFILIGQTQDLLADYFIPIGSDAEQINQVLSRLFPNGSERRDGDELSSREKEVLQLVAKGFSNKQIAASLFISINTVITHRKNITSKLGIKTVAGLAVYATLKGLNESDT